MPTVEIDASSFGPRRTVDAPEGGRLLDLCDDARAAIPFSCRSASCGTCRVRVLEGEALVVSAGIDERETLALFDAPPSVRLACVAIVRRGEGRLRIALEDDPLEGR